MDSQSATSITFIISPYHVGQRNHRVGNGPDRILQWGVVAEIDRLGVQTHIVEVEPVDDFEGEIGQSFEILRRTSQLVSAARSQQSFPIILSGNCMATVGVAAGLGLKNPGFIYFDAHDDLATPSTIENGYLDAMGMSILAGQSFQALWSTVPGHEISQHIDYSKLLYCGLRDIGEAQKQTARDTGATIIWGGESEPTEFASELKKSLAQKDFSPALVHLDLDVLDASLGKVNGYESPGGLFEGDLMGCMTVTAQDVIPVSLTVCSFDPDLGGGHRIARIAVRAVTRFVEILCKKGVLVGSST